MYDPCPRLCRNASTCCRDCAAEAGRGLVDFGCGDARPGLWSEPFRTDVAGSFVAENSGGDGSMSPRMVKRARTGFMVMFRFRIAHEICFLNLKRDGDWSGVEAALLTTSSGGGVLTRRRIAGRRASARWEAVKEKAESGNTESGNGRK